MERSSSWAKTDWLRLSIVVLHGRTTLRRSVVILHWRTSLRRTVVRIRGLLRICQYETSVQLYVHRQVSRGGASSSPSAGAVSERARAQAGDCAALVALLL